MDINNIKYTDLLKHKLYDAYFPYSYIPMVIDREEKAGYEKLLRDIQEILCICTREYLDNPEYRKYFEFGKTLEELILLPCPYEELIPVGRYDGFIDAETGCFKFCEFNTDGTACMNRSVTISEALLTSAAETGELNNKEYGVIDCVKLIAEELLRIYGTTSYALSRPKPNIAIVDFKDEVTGDDVKGFIKVFTDLGLEACFTDIGDLRFDGYDLTDAASGRKIDMIYRRAVTGHIADRIEEVGALIEAVKTQSVVMLGHFRTFVAHSKTMSIMLHHPATQKLLDAKQQSLVKESIPFSCFLDNDMPEAVKANVLVHKDDWIIKPRDGLNAGGVYAGVDMNEEEWCSLIDEKTGTDYILQEMIKRSKTVLWSSWEAKPAETHLMLGMFQAGSNPAGYYGRAGSKGIINPPHLGMAVPILIKK